MTLRHPMRAVSILGAALLIAPGARAVPVEYDVTVTDTALAVRACVESARNVRRWYVPGDGAERYLVDAKRTSGATLSRNDGDLLARDWRAGECLDYRIDLAALSRAAGAGRELEGTLLAPPRDWLWRPWDANERTLGELRFELPAGWSLTVPWPSLDALPPRRRFRFDVGAPVWPTLVAFGRFPERDVVTEHGSARLALLGAIDPAQRDVLTDYLEKTSRDVTAAFPHVFLAGPQIAVLPSRGGRDAVPFGQSFRGGAVALILYVDVHRTLADYFASWTVHHEMIHLLHPYLRDEGRWISEGIATYFQNVVRARHGRITAREAWTKLDEGFERGRRDEVTTDVTTTSEQLDRGRHYMRVYWAGTALALRGDVALRTRREDPTTLETALNAFAACCLAAHPVMAPRAYLAAVDRGAGGGPLAQLFDAHARAKGMPDIAPAYAALGIARKNGVLHFDRDPAHVALRTAIMGSDVER